MTRTIRLTTAEAIVRWLTVQRTVIDGEDVPLFPGVYAIFGHGNVTCLGHALEGAADVLPTWRAQNEQGMALAAVGYAKAMRRQQIMVATTSIGPGALNMVTAAGVAMADRLPLLLLTGDTFVSRTPDPVLQQIEHPGSPTLTANDAFRPVVRYWDRIMHPQQLLQALPQALRTLLDPAECGPALIALPQDVQALAFDFPEEFFSVQRRVIPRPRADSRELAQAASLLASAKRPLIVAGGGVHYSLAESELADFASKHGIPVVETMAGKSSLLATHPSWSGPIGVTGWSEANTVSAEADVVLAVGTRLQDFTTGSWTVFGGSGVRLIGINTARFDAVKHGSLPVVGDAREALIELDAMLGGWKAPTAWLEGAQAQTAMGKARVGKATSPKEGLPTYAQVVGAVNRFASDEDYVVTAAGGLPGEINVNWYSKGIATFDCEYGFSCMGYEVAGAWGAAMARADRGGDVYSLVGDGSYLMLNSEVYSSVLAGHKMIVVLCDNGGFAVIERLQVAQGGASFNNMLETSRVSTSIRADFVKHAESLGCISERVSGIAELETALARARAATRTTVIVLETDPNAWSDDGAFWEVGVPEISRRSEVRKARQRLEESKAGQWIGG